MTKPKNKKYPFGKYVSEKTRLANEEAQKERERVDERSEVVIEDDEVNNLFHIQKMNVESVNQQYAANLIVATVVLLYSIASPDYITQNLKSIIFVLSVQTVNFGCTVYRAHLTETRQFYRCKFLPTVFKVVKAASYWLMLNVVVDYMEKHMPVTNYSTLLKWCLIISNKGFIAYLAYSILIGEGMVMNQYWSWANPTSNEVTSDQEDDNTNNQDNSDYEEEDTDEEESDEDEEGNSRKKNN